MQVFQSILAGCGFSIPFTRMLLLKDFTKLVHKHKDVITRTYVDDAPMVCKAARELMCSLLSLLESHACVGASMLQRLSTLHLDEHYSDAA